MKIGIAGLGLIGGSIAKAYKADTEAGSGAAVFGYDTDKTILGFARLSGAVDGELDENAVGDCDVIFIAVYPSDAANYLNSIAEKVRPDTIVIDCCGTKRCVCAECFEIAEKHGFTFVGGHPMAGTQYSGFRHSRANLFSGASMIIVPPRFDDIALVERVKRLLAPLRFDRITVTDAAAHDRMIAYTSQLAHVVSNAYVKSPTALSHRGFSAGSYKDLTRVARLNEKMWSGLFLENRDNLVSELDFLMESLAKYRRAIAEGDGEALTALLAEGVKKKEEAEKQ